MKKLALLVALFASPTLADDAALEKFVPSTDEAKACWSSNFPDAPAAQRVFDMALNMQVDDQGDRKLWNFELFVTQAGQPRASAVGNCLPNADGSISCNIECDGGGVDVELLKSGDVRVSLEETGFIRLLACGAEGEPARLDAGAFDTLYLLAARPVEKCPAVINPGDDLPGID